MYSVTAHRVVVSQPEYLAFEGDGQAIFARHARKTNAWNYRGATPQRHSVSRTGGFLSGRIKLQHLSASTAQQAGLASLSESQAGLREWYSLSATGETVIRMHKDDALIIDGNLRTVGQVWEDNFNI